MGGRSTIVKIVEAMESVNMVGVSTFAKIVEAMDYVNTTE